MQRHLEIGPGRTRIPGFETVNVVQTAVTDHVADARALPFEDNTFAIVYASHVIEHVPWWETETTLREWRRVLQPGGALEVWTVDAAMVARLLLDAEYGLGSFRQPDSFDKYGADKNPFLWCNGRIFAYDKDGLAPQNWHKAMFTPRHLRECMQRAGLADVTLMERSEVRGADHGEINLGLRGIKP